MAADSPPIDPPEREPEAAGRPSGRRWLVYGLLFLLTAIAYVDRAVLSVAAPSIAREFAVSPIAMGYLLSSFLWSYLICLLPLGLLVDRLGARFTAAGGIALWCLATVAAGLSSGLAPMLGARLALGAGEASVYPSGLRVVREWAPRKERGVATGFLNGGGYAGPAFGALATGWLVGAYGWRWGFIVTGAAGLAWLVPWMLWYRPRVAPVEAEPAMEAQTTPLPRLLRSVNIWGTFLTQGCVVYSQYLFLTWLPSYLQATKGLNVQGSGLYTAIPYAVSVIMSVAICHASDRLLSEQDRLSGKRRRVVALMAAVSAVVLAAPFVQSVWAITLLISVSLTGIASAVSLNFALANDLVRSRADVGKATAILVIGGNLFGAAAPIVTGYMVAGPGGYNSAFLIAGALLVVGVTAALALTPAERQSALGESVRGFAARTRSKRL